MTTDAVGGVWSYSLQLADALAAEAFEVVLAVLGPAPSAAQRAELDASCVARSFELPQALEWMPDPWADVDEAGRRLLDVEREVGPDVVHLNGYVHADLAWASPTVVVAHSDVLSWWRAVHGHAAPPAWSTYASRVGSGLRAADAVVAPSRAMLTALHREHEFSGGTVIPNGRRADWVHHVAKEPLIVGVGRMWDAAKNLEALGLAAAVVDWPVALIGAGSEQQPTPPYVGLGALPFTAVAEWLGRATIFAGPARYEPFGLAALEAAHSGCALVLGDIPTQRELWGDAAVFVDPTRPGDLGPVLQELCRDPDRCSELGRRARVRAERYTPEAMARSYGALYRSLPAAVGGRR
jgi:glycosyltransferase involved in cell wall biosynthesis